MPSDSFYQTAAILDYRRLGKQRVEAYQILKIITGKDKDSKWRNHPAVLMWEGHWGALYQYTDIMCKIWVERGYVDNLRTRLREEFWPPEDLSRPAWLDDPRFCSAHRAALLHKDWLYYQRFGWTEEPKLDYYWPVKTESKCPRSPIRFLSLELIS